MEQQYKSLGSLSRSQEELLRSFFAPAPDTLKGLKVESFGTKSDEPVRFFLYADVLEELFKAARYREEPGLAALLGQFSVDEEGPFLEITAFSDLRYLYEDGVDLVEFFEPTMDSIFSTLIDEEETRHIVGVFVSQPGGNALLGEEIARLHLSLFNMPFQLALVIDGQGNELGCYARLPGAPFFNAPFYLVKESEADTPEGEEVEQPLDQDETNLPKPIEVDDE